MSAGSCLEGPALPGPLQDTVRQLLAPPLGDVHRDPDVEVERLGRVLAWLASPRRSADALRRAALEADSGRVTTVLDAVLPPVPDHLVSVVAALAGTWVRLGVRAATVADALYPARLASGWPQVDAPPLLAWRGQLPASGAVVAIVGARRATAYGTGVAAWLAEAVARAGGTVVSGGALGIDAAAHLAAIEQPGGTAVVLGCGHAVAYPRPHAGPGGLFDRVVDHGGSLLSEQLPHAQPHAGNVRARNRIVAGLADVVVVVEGGARSGALLTATAAAERGVPVLAVPGDVRAPGSAAPHRLLTEGAAPCTSPADLLEALGSSVPVGDARDGAARASASVLPGDVHAILAAAWPRPVALDDLVARTGRPASSLLGALTRARVAGETADDTEGVRLRRAPPEPADAGRG